MNRAVHHVYILPLTSSVESEGAVGGRAYVKGARKRKYAEKYNANFPATPYFVVQSCTAKESGKRRVLMLSSRKFALKATYPVITKSPPNPHKTAQLLP